MNALHFWCTPIWALIGGLGSQFVTVPPRPTFGVGVIRQDSLSIHDERAREIAQQLNERFEALEQCVANGLARVAADAAEYSLARLSIEKGAGGELVLAGEYSWPADRDGTPDEVNKACLDYDSEALPVRTIVARLHQHLLYDTLLNHERGPYGLIEVVDAESDDALRVWRLDLRSNKPLCLEEGIKYRLHFGDEPTDCYFQLRPAGHSPERGIYAFELPPNGNAEAIQRLVSEDLIALEAQLHMRFQPPSADLTEHPRVLDLSDYFVDSREVCQ